MTIPQPDPGARTPYAEWVLNSPLNRWRRAFGKSEAELAAVLLVPVEVVEEWESGVGNKPTDDRLVAQLDGLLGPGWQKRWDDWYADRPGFYDVEDA